jgi:hypothetical protein
MTYRTDVVKNEEPANPYTGSSLVPMARDRARADLCGNDRGVGIELKSIRVIASEAKQSTSPLAEAWIASSRCSSQ